MNRYRLERVVVAQGGVTVWEATDLRDGRRVRLGMFAGGSAVLDHGGMDGGMFVVVDASPRAPARLELVEISDEDAFFEEPPADELFEPAAAPRRTRAKLWAAGLVAAIAFGVLGLYVAMRPAAASEATITAAPIDVATNAPTQVAPAAPPAPPTAVQPVVAPVQSVAAPAPTHPPKAHRVPRRAPRHHASPPPPQSDPLTL